MNTANPQERIKALEAIIDRQMGIEDRYEELLLTARRCLRTARRCLRYNGDDQERFDLYMRVLDIMVERHTRETAEMDRGEKAE